MTACMCSRVLPAAYQVRTLLACLLLVTCHLCPLAWTHTTVHTTHTTHTLSSSWWDSSCPTQAGRTCYLCKVNPGIYWRSQALNNTNSTKNLNLSLKRYRVRTTSVWCRCGLQGDASLGRSDLFHLFPLFSKAIWVNDKEIALLPDGRF